MNKRVKKIIIFLGIIFGFFLQAGFALALELHYPTICLGQCFSLNDTSSFPEYARYFFNLGMALACFIAVGAVAFGGIYYLIDFARGKFKDEGKEWIKAGITGLLIVVCAYLIVYTINPDLVAFKLGDLPAIFLNNPLTDTTPPGVDSATYQEIPIGTLTETLLTRTMSCYEFDSEGNPLDYATIDSSASPIKDDNGEEYSSPTYFIPTYMDHDRADCLLQLIDGAQKKAQVIAKVSDKIIRLMKTCTCEGKCDDPCNSDGTGCNDDPPSCTGSCKGAACAPKDSESCCDAETKDKIEHGLIEIEPGCPTADISIDPNFLDPSFADPSDRNNSQCEVESTGGAIAETQKITIDSSVKLEAVQWAINEWNKYSSSGFQFFGTITVDDSFVNSYCLPVAPTMKCKSKTTPVPNNNIIIYSQDIDMEGTIPWNPAAFNRWNMSGGTVNWSEINVNPNSSDINTDQSYRMTILHELGHSLGLADTYDTSTGKANPNCNYKSTMNNQFIMTGVGESEIDALTSFYGSSSLSHATNPFLSSLLSSQGLSVAIAASDTENTYHGLDEFRCDKGEYESCDDIAEYIEKEVKLDGKTITVIDQTKWEKLNLIQQLTYLKEKIDELKQKIEKDASNLSDAETALGKCYLAIPYIDFLKTYQSTDQETRIISVQRTFTDPETNDTVDASKYCKGFNYGNSSCLKKCNDICPDTSQQAMQCYRDCPKCEEGGAECRTEQETCIENCYGSRPCIYSSESSQTFLTDNNGDIDDNSCISSCRTDCSDICSEKYLLDSSEYKFCQDQCNNNSQCVLDNADSCLFGAQGFTDCASQAQAADQGNIKHCFDKAYLCKNGSDEYAGYPDCANSSSICSQYTSSFLYGHPRCQKCPNPYNSPEEGTVCYSKTKTDASCQELCPETTKCPASSNCPDCPCDQINQTLKFCIPNESNPDNAGQEGSTVKSQKISAYEITSPQCNEYARNDDPLTFYCENSWWNNPNREGLSENPIGAERNCPKEQEVPVGQTVDDAENWASSIIKVADDCIQNIQDIFDMLEKITKKQPNQYCACDSKYDSGDPICASYCRYNPPVTDPDTNEEITPASCSFAPCSGNPCKQIIDYLSQVWNDYKQLKTDFIIFYTAMLQEPRSDIMKELTYSRQTTSSCSVTQNNFGNQARMLSCARAEDELIPDIINGNTIFQNKTVQHYCYGKNLGKLFNETTADNWFCCDLQKINSNPAK